MRLIVQKMAYLLVSNSLECSLPKMLKLMASLAGGRGKVSPSLLYYYGTASVESNK